MKNEKNVMAWVDQGMPEDSLSLQTFGITMEDIRELQARVMTAVVYKKLDDQTKIVFDEHGTLQ